MTSILLFVLATILAYLSHETTASAIERALLTFAIIGVVAVMLVGIWNAICDWTGNRHLVRFNIDE